MLPLKHFDLKDYRKFIWFSLNSPFIYADGLFHGSRLIGRRRPKMLFGPSIFHLKLSPRRIRHPMTFVIMSEMVAV